MSSWTQITHQARNVESLSWLPFSFLVFFSSVALMLLSPTDCLVFVWKLSQTKAVSYGSKLIHFHKCDNIWANKSKSCYPGKWKQPLLSTSAHSAIANRNSLCREDRQYLPMWPKNYYRITVFVKK